MSHEAIARAPTSRLRESLEIPVFMHRDDDWRYMDEILDVLPNGSVTVNGIVVGSLRDDDDGQRLTIDLGWAKAALLHVLVLGDRAVDKGRKPLVDR